MRAPRCDQGLELLHPELLHPRQASAAAQPAPQTRGRAGLVLVLVPVPVPVLPATVPTVQTLVLALLALVLVQARLRLLYDLQVRCFHTECAPATLNHVPLIDFSAGSDDPSDRSVHLLPAGGRQSVDPHAHRV